MASTVETTELAEHIKTVYTNYKDNRLDHENRWMRNRAAAQADLDLDEHGVWKKSERAEDWQSDTMVDVVRQKVVTAKATIMDTAFKGGKVQFMLVPARGGEEPAPEVDGNLQADRDEVIISNERYIERQLENCDAVDEFSKCIHSGAVYGRYFAKRYTTDMNCDGFEPIAENVFVESEERSDTLAIENKSVFNMFWDMETDDLKTGEAVIERDYISHSELRSDIGKPFHFESAIKKALKDCEDSDNTLGDDSEAVPEKLRDIKKRTRLIRKLEYWGQVPRKKAEAFEEMLEKDLDIEPEAFKNTEDDPEDRGDVVEVFAIVAGQHVIAYTRITSPKERPYYMEDWEVVLDGNCGRSIADNLASVMKVLNGATRTLEDNMKLSSKLILALKRAMVKEDIEQELSSDKAHVVLTLDEESIASIKDSIQQIKIDPLLNELSSLIEMYINFADMASSIPRAEQGQQSNNPQTAFELQQRLSRSGKYMGEIIKRMDRFIKEIINDFYRYNMLDPDLPVEKGIYKIKALGFSSFENQVIRLQTLMQFFALVADRPDILAEVDVRWIIEEIAKAMDLDPEQVFKSDEKKQQEAEAQQNSPEAQAQELEMARLQKELEKLDSEIAKNQAAMEKSGTDSEKSRHDMMIAEENLKLERAKLVEDIKEKRREPAQQKVSQ